MLKQLVVFGLGAGILSASIGSMAQGNPVISYRQKVMQSNGANLGAVADILKYQLPYQQNIKVHAEALSQAASLIPSAFKAKVFEGRTDAKPAIWENWDKFVKYADDLKKASDTLAEVAGGGDAAAIGAQVQKVGHACKECHDDFRKPREESYKKKR
ncbi:MAG: cytochrome c [Arenicellales bacterium]|jgi:cytochrome c556